MSAASALTARLMETWAHIQDIADALGISREPTERLRHIAYLGVGARSFSYAIRGTPRCYRDRLSAAWKCRSDRIGARPRCQTTSNCGAHNALDEEKPDSR